MRLCRNAGRAADTSSGKLQEPKKTSGKRILCAKIVRPAVAAKSGPNAHARGNPKLDRRTPVGKTKSHGALGRSSTSVRNSRACESIWPGNTCRRFLLASGKLEPCIEQIEQPQGTKKKNKTSGNLAPGVAPCEDQSLTGCSRTQSIWRMELEPKMKTQI
jgi:hypothetical protein